MRQMVFVAFVVLSMATQAQSALNSRQFKKYWRVESESPDYRVTFRGDTCEILSPKGLTLWRKEQLHEGQTVEYDACVMDEGKEGDRLSDLNCFFLASDPHARDIWARASWRSGIFTRCYTLQTYYLGYGGNHNTTTRFRRYDGDEAGVEDAARRPAILKEYTDEAHLLKANHWYHVKIESKTGHTRFFIDGECIVDYADPQPLREGWFGFRTTLSRTCITNFRYYDTPTLNYGSTGVPLHWLDGTPPVAQPVSFGVPFAQGELRDVATLTLNHGIATDTWVNARWPDGSVKWAGMAAVVPGDIDDLKVVRQSAKVKDSSLTVSEDARHITIQTGRLMVWLSKNGQLLFDSLSIDGRRVGGGAVLTASANGVDYTSSVRKMTVEHQGRVRAVVRIEGVHQSPDREWLPFTIRLYFYAGSEQVRMVHTFVYDGDQQHDMISSLGVRLRVPMREAAYNRHVAFATGDDGVWSEPVQVLEGGSDRSRLRALQMSGAHIAVDAIPPRMRPLLSDWAQWDGYRLSQLTDNSFSIRKRATAVSPWLGTLTGVRSPGYAFVGDTQGGIGVALKDFWQSYPSTIEVDKARSDEAELTLWLWSPEAEPMNLCHYDTVAHGLRASYEDVQEGLSTPYGIARSSVVWILPQASYGGKTQVAADARRLTADARLLPTPEYLYEKRTFGIWSLPQGDNAVERRLSQYIDFYRDAIEQQKWYGFWNYGDIMHAYDIDRHSWRYDVGGYAWDNTELATPMWLWYNFLRTGRADVWRMAEAMTRHNSEVDTYHIGPLAPLGSRHNVSHWGCGAKEARISQAAFSRFYYYLTTDERTGDLMTEQVDADTLLYHLDPMRLAEPREKYPCSAPARLRVGPDWLAYAGNWMTEWERTGNLKYRDKIVTGMRSIAALPDGVFTGNLAKGYDPATGRLSYDGDPALRSTNHLLSIMGGFEVMNELLPLTGETSFAATWLDLARRYKKMALEIRHNNFPVRRLEAYAAWHDRDAARMAATWQALWGLADHGLRLPEASTHLMPPEVPMPMDELPGLSTNNAALWSLDAIYMLEVINP
ncbi:MAG: hypothetical protein J5637_08045 [Prevotella sp.]|nr:hypothetical protein [Prevotella sp.]